MSEKVETADTFSASPDSFTELPVEAVNRKPGCMRGRVRIAPDFDAPLPAGLFDRDV